MEASRQRGLCPDIGSTVTDNEALDSLLEKVYRDSGYDFRQYRRGTITRRLQRRFYATGTRTLLGYTRFLDTNPEEYQRLADTLTIKVSAFFRSSYTFQQVARLVLPGLISDRRNRAKQSLSIWSTACARGEEPYSIAILVAEYLGHRLRDFDISIHATDISRRCLKEAQAGIYSSREIESPAPVIPGDYFTRQDGGYAVDNYIRQMVNFSYFDLVSTEAPPFINLDCVFCCNILIYLQKQLQERVLGMMYNSLATPGYLILGEAETPTSSLLRKLECLDARARIYKKNTA